MTSKANSVLIGDPSTPSPIRIEFADDEPSPEP